MTVYNFYIGLLDKDTKVQEIPTDAAVAMIKRQCISFFGGATIFQAQGIYTHDNGEMVTENTVKVEVFDVDIQTVKNFVDTIKADLNQESIAVNIAQMDSFYM